LLTNLVPRAVWSSLGLPCLPLQLTACLAAPIGWQRFPQPFSQPRLDRGSSVEDALFTNSPPRAACRGPREPSARTRGRSRKRGPCHAPLPGVTRACLHQCK
jgi:hypothetical protein